MKNKSNRFSQARISHQVSSRGRRGAVSSGVFDLRDAESYSTVGTSRIARKGGHAEGMRPQRGLRGLRRASLCLENDAGYGASPPVAGSW